MNVQDICTRRFVQMDKYRKVPNAYLNENNKHDYHSVSQAPIL